MHIQLRETTVALAQPIPVTIIFKNFTDAAIVREISPERSMAIEMHVLDARTREDLSFTMGKVGTTPLGGDEYALVTPTPERFEIAARSAFEFTVDLHERLYLRPGRFECFVTDGAAQSDHVALTITFTRESVDDLYKKIARDPNADYSRREWAAALLQRLYPRFKLTLSLPGDPPDVVARNEADNRRIYEEFEAWWARSRAAPGIEETLRLIR